MQHADGQQVELGSAVHLLLEVLEPVDVAFGLAVAPRRAEGGSHGRQVSVEASSQAPQLGDRAGACPRQPAVEAGEVPAVDEAEEPLCQTARFGDREWLISGAHRRS